ncbi:MAG: ATP-grasp domain-containing protein [Tissierellia bacterium]|nr:ATP-grasp domain-containing protein [Tissierellia bacterium]
MKGYLIEKYSDMQDAYTVNRIIEEGEKAGVEIDLLGVADCYLWKGRVYHNNIPLEGRDFVINRYKYGFIVDKINELCSKSYNDNKLFKLYVSKYRQVDRLNLKECLLPRYVLANMGMGFEDIVARLGSPFVAKGLDSSQGKEIFLISNKDEYSDLQAGYDLRDELIFQEFIESSKGRDIRIYSICGEAVACMMRTNEYDFRANVARGGKIEEYPIDGKIRAIAKEIYTKTKLDFLGIDLLLGEKDYYFCEINVMAGIEGIETATGANIAKMIIDKVRGDFDGH